MEKIYFIDESLDRMGGVERVISTLANDFINEYEVSLISLFKSNQNSYYKYDDRIKSFYIFDRYKLNSKKYKKGELLYYINRFFEKIFEKIKLNFGIKKIVKKINYESIIVFGGVQTAIKFLPYINCKKVIVREAVHYYCYNKKQQNIIKKYFIDKVNIVITSSDENISIYNKIFNNKLNIIKIYNPLGIKPIKNENLDSESIVSIGRFDKQKGYDYLIPAFKYVVKKHPEWKLRIIGDGYYKTEMVKIINDNNLQKSVILEPSTKDIVKEINKSSIYVLASRFEGYANSLVEAMACGLPSISYDWLVGVDDIITDGENGLIVRLEDRFKYFYNKEINANDIISLANKINILIEDKNLRKKLSDNAVKIVKTRNNQKIIEKWKNIIVSKK